MDRRVTRSWSFDTLEVVEQVVEPGLMPRPPLPIGTHGEIRTVQRGSSWLTRAKFRNHDGVTRVVGRRDARRRRRPTRCGLPCAIGPRRRPEASCTRTAGSARRQSCGSASWRRRSRRARALPPRWRSTSSSYGRSCCRAVRLGELTVPRLPAVLTATRRQHSAASAKTVRTILSGVRGLAVRYGVLPSNPVRDVGRIESRKKSARSLTSDELRDLLAKLDADKIAARHDLPDLARWYIGTGERTGEALAVHWHHVDLDAATVTWGGGVIRVKGQGQIINHGKTDVSARPLRLPAWVVVMLRRRRVMLAERYGVPECGVDGPVFPNSLGGLRDKHNTGARWRDFRERAGYSWVTFRTFRRSVATILDEAGLSAREIADQLGHSKVSTTQDVYMGRRMPSTRAAEALDTINPDDVPTT